MRDVKTNARWQAFPLTVRKQGFAKMTIIAMSYCHLRAYFAAILIGSIGMLSVPQAEATPEVKVKIAEFADLLKELSTYQGDGSKIDPERRPPANRQLSGRMGSEFNEDALPYDLDFRDPRYAQWSGQPIWR
jgi:hypothetical protein